MPAERAPMRKVREVLRLRHAIGVSERQIAVTVGVSRSTVGEYLRRAAVIGITWPVPEELDDGELAQRLFTPPMFEEILAKPLPDWSYVHNELKRRGVTRFCRLPASSGRASTRHVALITAIMQAKPHPEQGFRACLGILRLARSYGSARIEAACRRGNDIGARSYGSIKSILQHGLDRAYANDAPPPALPIHHRNIRGNGYYH